MLPRQQGQSHRRSNNATLRICVATACIGVATFIWFPGPPVVPALAAGLGLKPHFANHDALIERLRHVVDRQRRHRRSRQRLHLHARGTHRRRRRRDPHAAAHNLRRSHPRASAPADGTSESAPMSASRPESPRSAPPPADFPWDSVAVPSAPPPKLHKRRRRRRAPRACFALMSTMPALPLRQNAKACPACDPPSSSLLTPSESAPSRRRQTAGFFRHHHEAIRPPKCRQIAAAMPRNRRHLRRVAAAAGPAPRRQKPRERFALRSIASLSCAIAKRGPSFAQPASAASSGAPKSRNVTDDEIGFPGSPKNGNVRSRAGTSPKTTGLPGCMRTPVK